MVQASGQLVRVPRISGREMTPKYAESTSPHTITGPFMMNPAWAAGGTGLGSPSFLAHEALLGFHGSEHVPSHTPLLVHPTWSSLTQCSSHEHAGAALSDAPQHSIVLEKQSDMHRSKQENFYESIREAGLAQWQPGSFSFPTGACLTCFAICWHVVCLFATKPHGVRGLLPALTSLGFCQLAMPYTMNCWSHDV